MEIEDVKVVEKTTHGKIIALLVIACIILITDVGVWLLDALVIQKLWNWFIYPATNFHFTYWNMFGALLIPTVLNTASTLRAVQKENEDAIDSAAKSMSMLIIHVISTLLVWGLGAIIV